MLDAVAHRVRTLIADHLGVRADELAADLSLRDDLAADSLDLLEVSVALEDDLGIALSERLLDEVRTVGELVEATLSLARNRRPQAMRTEDASDPIRASARVIPAEGSGRPIFERTEWLTPYAIESIVDDALHAGRGARLEMSLAASTPAADIARIAERFQALSTRGIEVQVRREGPGPARRGPHSGTHDAVRA